MKKQLFLLAFGLSSSFLYAQQQPTVNTPSSGGISSPDFWSRAGNTSTNGINNILGTRWDSPIYFQTGTSSNWDIRMKINGIYSSGVYPVNGFTSSKEGYVLIGHFSQMTSNTSQQLYRDLGAFSRLHLNGLANTSEEGYRPWMQTGITFTDNRDLSYFGLRTLNPNGVSGKSETVLTWSDDPNNVNSTDVDRFSLRFFEHGSNSSGIVSSNRLLRTDSDGLMVGQFTGKGMFGLGNNFGVNTSGVNVGYIDPQSLLHMTYDWQNDIKFQPYGFMQITFRGANIGQGETANDGLRFGIDYDLKTVQGTNFLNGNLKWQENSSFIIQSDWNNTPGGTENGERVRISSANAPGVSSAQGNHGTGENVTRVALSYEGNHAITHPNALLHLGENADPGNTPAAWMDYGTLVIKDKSHMFTGVTGTGYTLESDMNVIGFRGNDLLIMNQPNGEFARINSTNGFTGFGNYGPGGTINQAPTERIDVEGNGRFRDIPAQGGQSLILGLQNTTNPTPEDLELSRLDFPNDNTQVLLGDGTWGNAGGGAGYFYCSANDPNANMTDDAEFVLNGHNFYFDGSAAPGTFTEQVGIGFPCNTTLGAKLDVLSPSGIAGNFWSNGGSSATFNVGAFGYSGGSGGGYIGVLGRTGGISPTFEAGVYGSGGDPNDPNPQAADRWSGYFTGPVYIGGTLINTSDRNLKQDIQPMKNALDIISRLETKTYYFDQVNNRDYQFSSKKQYGFISQEVQEIIPDAVQEVATPVEFDENGHPLPHSGETILGMNYSAIIPINSGAIKELNAKVESTISENEELRKENEDLANRLTELENCLSGILPYLCQLSNTAIHANSNDDQQAIRSELEVILNNHHGIVLDQNVPNPFAEQTMINFSIPESVEKAEIHFYNAEGRIIQSVLVNERGTGTLKVFGSDLSSGTYTYTLVADGINVATKKMIKQ